MDMIVGIVFTLFGLNLILNWMESPVEDYNGYGLYGVNEDYDNPWYKRPSFYGGVFFVYLGLSILLG